MLSILLLTCTNAKSAQFEDINILGISFNYDGLFKDSTAEFNGLLTPLNETNTNAYNYDTKKREQTVGLIVVLTIIATSMTLGDSL